jgi:hypothetical protein
MKKPLAAKILLAVASINGKLFEIVFFVLLPLFHIQIKKES